MSLNVRSLAFLTGGAAALLPTTVVHNFDNGSWIENIAVRSNGQLLVTELTHPRLWQVDPVKGGANVVHEFTNFTGLGGITEGQHDVFYVITDDFFSSTQPKINRSAIQQVDFNKDPTTITQIAELDQPGNVLDGLAYIPGTDVILATDYGLGVIWSINISTGKVDVAINNTYTQQAGIAATNGIKINQRPLYFTNSDKELLVKVDINDAGKAVGDFDVLVQGGIDPDDIVLGHGGKDVYIANSTNIVLVPAQGGRSNGKPIAIADTAGATSAAFGRTESDRGDLYVSSSGGDDQYSNPDDVRVNGKIFRIELGEHR